MQSLDLLVRTAAHTEELQPTLFIPDEVTECILVGIVQPDDFVFFIERKTHRRHGGTRRCVRGREASKWNVMIDKIFSLYFEIKTFRADAIPARKLF